jgi:adenosylmethionine-8-amino-7-oxononanoate aminotransferase
MSVCDPDDSMHRHFRGFLLEQYPHDLPVDDAGWRAFARFLEQVGDQCAGIIVEPLVQAATGMRFHSPEQLRRLADLARHAGLLFIADEIGTGFWRTGKRLACDWAGVVPDILCIGKSLTGGTLPMAVAMANLEKAVALNPYNCFYHLALADGLDAVGRYDETLKSLHKALIEAP